MKLSLKLFLISAIFGLSIAFSFKPRIDPVSAARENTLERVKQLIEKAKTVPNEGQVKKESHSVQVLRRTKTRVISFNHELTAEEISEIEATYDVKFSKKNSRKNRYVVTPGNEERITELSKRSEVEGIFNNDTYKVSAQTTDWGISKMNIPAAWGYLTPTTGNDIIVAVIDTGVQLNHPDLSAAIQAGGYDYVDNDSVPEDPHGHGTHVAGIIAATNNSVGTVGAAYNAKILPMRVCASSGEETTCGSIAIADAIEDSITAGVDIINLSLGGSANELIRQAIDDATAAGIIVVAASGNSNQGGCLYPAAYENVVCVGSVNDVDVKASFSNYGTGLDVVTPGVNIESLGLGSTYTTLSGTSMSTAYYSGAAAIVSSMIKQVCITQPSNEACSDIRAYTQLMINDLTIRDIGTPGLDSHTGKGIVDLSQLFSETLPNHTAPQSLITKGLQYSQPITLTNYNPYNIALSSCTIMSNDMSRVQTVPSFSITALTQGATTYSSPTHNGIYSTFTFSTPITIVSGNTLNFSYNYTASSETVPNDVIAYSFTCTSDRVGTTAIEQYRSEPATLTTLVDLPATLKNVYFTFGKLKYNQTVPTSQLYATDTVYLKNYNPSQVKLTQFFLYDYVKKGNQGFTKTYKTSTSFTVKTNYLLPKPRKYAYIAEFQDLATGIKIKKYFVFYTK